MIKRDMRHLQQHLNQKEWHCMTKVSGKRTEARIASQAKYQAKRAGRPRMPGLYLSQEEADLLERMAARCGSKKAALMEGLKMLDDVINHIDK